jgi:hypothetical protein
MGLGKCCRQDPSFLMCASADGEGSRVCSWIIIRATGGDTIFFHEAKKSILKADLTFNYGTPALSPFPARIPPGSPRGGEKYWVYGWILRINRRTAEEYYPFLRKQRTTKSLYPSRSCDHQILPSRSPHRTFGE